MPIELAIVCGRIENPVRIEPLGSGRSALGAGPLDPVRPVELVVAEVRVVARTARRALSPGLESAFGVVPLDEWPSRPVTKVHAPRIEKDSEIGPRLAGRVKSLTHEVHCAIRIRDASSFLAPQRRGQHVRVLRGLGREIHKK